MRRCLILLILLVLVLPVVEVGNSNQISPISQESPRLRNSGSNEASVSGGGSKNKFWMQMFSDVLDIKIRRSLYDNGASLGSALLAGIGSGAFKSFRQAVEKVCRYDRDFLPAAGNIEEYEKYYRLYEDFMQDTILQLDKLERLH